MSEDETPAQRTRRLWADPRTRAALHLGPLQKRLEAAVRRRDAGERPYPLDNLALLHFGEKELNPREAEKPKEPRWGVGLEILEALRQHSEGLTTQELCIILGRPERGPGGGVREALGGLRNVLHQPILMTPEGRFRLLRPGEY